jgi:hypothetical protein
MGELLSVSAWVMHAYETESWGTGGFGSNIRLIDMGDVQARNERALLEECIW